MDESNVDKENPLDPRERAARIHLFEANKMEAWVRAEYPDLSTSECHERGALGRAFWHLGYVTALRDRAAGLRHDLNGRPELFPGIGSPEPLPEIDSDGYLVNADPLWDIPRGPLFGLRILTTPHDDRHYEARRFRGVRAFARR